MKIAIGTDHRGVKLKEKLLTKLTKLGYEIIDCSPQNYATDDYPDYALKVSLKIIKKEADFGVLICGNGVGMSIAANKIKGIRCALINNIESSKFSRRDDNANIIALNSGINFTKSTKILQTFFKTEFSTEEKYQRRLNKIIKIENGEYDEL